MPLPKGVSPWIPRANRPCDIKPDYSRGRALYGAADYEPRFAAMRRTD